MQLGVSPNDADRWSYPVIRERPSVGQDKEIGGQFSDRSNPDERHRSIKILDDEVQGMGHSLVTADAKTPQGRSTHQHGGRSKPKGFGHISTEPDSRIHQHLAASVHRLDDLNQRTGCRHGGIELTTTVIRDDYPGGSMVQGLHRSVAPQDPLHQHRHRSASHCGLQGVPGLEHGPLVEQVTAWLEELWSPKEISGRLTREHPNDPTMHVSHETIYQSLYVQGRGELRRELARCLRSGRTQRKAQGRIETRGRIKDMVMISERPAEVEDRAVPGHWEGDLVMGAGGRSAVGTLVERSTRYLLLLHLPDGKGAVEVEAAMKAAIATLPRELAKTITWDQGKEMARHSEFSIATGIPVYFCDPHSPWQRGSNENTNGLLRQYLPKGTDLSKQSTEDLARIQRSLNGRPRETLQFMTPSEKLAELVAFTGRIRQGKSRSPEGDRPESG